MRRLLLRLGRWLVLLGLLFLLVPIPLVLILRIIEPPTTMLMMLRMVERVFDGARYIMERGLVADLSIVHAWMGDTEGNLVYRKTARNFNPMMATAGRTTVAEVEHLVEPGEMNPDHIITPGVFVQRIVHVANAVKHIEQRTTRKRSDTPAGTGEHA